MFSQTLGTALGDWVADTNEIGYLGAAAVFGGLLVLTAILYYGNELFAYHFVLGRIHFNSSARRYRRRFARQTNRERRPGSEPLHCVFRHPGADGRVDSDLPAEAGFQSALKKSEEEDAQ